MRKDSDFLSNHQIFIELFSPLRDRAFRGRDKKYYFLSIVFSRVLYFFLRMKIFFPPEKNKFLLSAAFAESRKKCKDR
jgi:hypothetical protein